MNFSSGSALVEEAVELRLTENFGRQVKILRTGSIGGGCINHASKIETTEGNFFLKWNSDCPEDIFIREAECLEELKKAAGDLLVVPEVYAVGGVGETPGFLVLEYLEPGHGNHSSDEELGRGLAAIHKFGSDRFGFHNDNYCGSTLQNNTWNQNWAEFFRDCRLGFLLDLISSDRQISVEEVKVYRRLQEKIIRIVPDDATPVLIHGDLWSGNYMMTIKGPALIDPASYYADAEMEMGIMTLFGGFSERFYKAYNEINPLRADWKTRNRLYQLYHVLNHYLLFGGSYRNQAVQIASGYL